MSHSGWRATDHCLWLRSLRSDVRVALPGLCSHTSAVMCAEPTSSQLISGLPHFSGWETFTSVEEPALSEVSTPMQCRGLKAPRCSALVVLLTALCHATAIVFTGNVPNDFQLTDPTVFLVTSSGPLLVGPTGWQLYDMRWAYDSTTDTAYFGE